MTNNLDFTTLRTANVLRCEHGWGHRLKGWSVAEWGNAAAGELGEACNVAKKMLRWDHDIRTELAAKSRDGYKEDLRQEIADTLIYLDLWAASEGIDLGEAVRLAFNNKSDEIGSEIKI